MASPGTRHLSALCLVDPLEFRRRVIDAYMANKARFDWTADALSVHRATLLKLVRTVEGLESELAEIRVRGRTEGWADQHYAQGGRPKGSRDSTPRKRRSDRGIKKALLTRA